MRARWLALFVVSLGCPAPEPEPVVPAPPPCAARVDAPREVQAAVGERVDFTVRVTNPAAEPALLTDLEFTPDAGFELSVSGAQPIRAGTCASPGVLELPLRFAPRVLGLQNAVLQGRVGDLSFQVPLRGLGLGPRFEVSEWISFGVMTVDETTPRSVPLRNTGTAGTQVRVEVVRVLAGNAETRVDELCLGRWTGTACETAPLVVEREFPLPARVLATTPGVREWLVTLRSSEFGQPTKQVRVSAALIDTRGCHLVPSVRALEFTPPMEVKGVSLENQGSGDCLIDSLQTTNAAFRIPTSVSQRRRLVPWQSVQVSVTGLLRSVDDPLEGELTAVLLGGSPPPLKVPLRFAVSPVAGCVSFAPSSVDLGVRQEGCGGRRREVVFRNSCASPILVQRIELSGPFTFSLRSNFSRGVLAPAAVISHEVVSLGGGVGVQLGALEVLGVGGAASLPVRSETVPRATRTETFQTDAWPRSDILYILDDSPSFTVHQARTDTALTNFAQRVATEFINARVGVTTASRTAVAGQLRALPSGATWTTIPSPSFISDFAALVAARDAGSEEESCLEAAVHASTQAVGFWRPGVPRAFVCVTDADEGAVELDAGIAQLVASVDGGSVSYSVVSGRPASTCAVESTGSRHEPIVNALVGVHEDVCAAGWWNGFFGLGGPGGLRTRFFLESAPDLAFRTPTVTLDGVPLPRLAPDGGVLWSLDPASNSLTLDPSLVRSPDAIQIAITYAPVCQ